MNQENSGDTENERGKGKKFTVNRTNRRSSAGKDQVCLDDDANGDEDENEGNQMEESNSQSSNESDSDGP